MNARNDPSALQMYADLIAAKLEDLKESMREDGKRRDAFVNNLDLLNKGEFAAIKAMMADILKMIGGLPTKDDHFKLSDRVYRLEQAQAITGSKVDDLCETTEKHEARLQSLEGDRHKAQGAGWASGKFWTAITSAGGIGALLSWFITQGAK